jgi:hypothetical protein
VPQPFWVGDSREQAVGEFGPLREGALIEKFPLNHRDRAIGDDTENGDVFPFSFASPSGKGNGQLIGCRADAGRRKAVYLDVRVSIANHVRNENSEEKQKE